MKQKIVVRVSVSCEKCSKKAMQVAAVADGVTSVALEGDYRDKLVVVGDGIDAACLVARLRKKACYATLESLGEVKPPVTDKPVPQNGGDGKKGGDGGDGKKGGDGGGGKKGGSGGAGGGAKKGGGGGAGGNNGGGGNCCIDRDNEQHHQCQWSCCQQQPPCEMYKVVFDSYGPTTGCIIM